jgi:hypothetical protein
LWHRATDRLEIGLSAGFKPGNPPAAEGEAETKAREETGNNISIGGRVLLSPATSLRGKINCDSKIGVGLESKIREGKKIHTCVILKAFFHTAVFLSKKCA